MVKRLPRWASEYRDRHGKVRIRFRRKGFATYHFAAKFPSREWWQEYDACLKGEAAERVKPGIDRTIPGSIAHLIAAYLASPQGQTPAPSTRRTYRAILERLRANIGDAPAKSLDYAAAASIIGRMANRPAAANRLRKTASMVWTEGQRLGLVDSNPWRLVKPLPMPGEGYRPWTEEDVATFESRWRVGTRERLALALMLHTAQRRGDAIRLGPQHVRNGRLQFTQAKTGQTVDIPMTSGLREAIAAAPTGLVSFLVTSRGKPFDAATFGNWWGRACKAAGLGAAGSHGLRKLALTRLALHGATHAQIKAWSGHRTDAQVSRYIEAANRSQLADAGAAKMANPAARLAKIKRNTLKEGD